MNCVYLSLGSNLGSRLKNILAAAELLKKSNINIVKNSSIYETLPYGEKDQPNFLNVVFKCDTDLKPEPLLKKIKEIESALGRTETIRWGPRIIDIDILLYNNLIIRSRDLNIPHIELKKRDFFIVPLLEIDANILDPETSMPIKNYLFNLPIHIVNSVRIELASDRKA